MLGRALAFLFIGRNPLGIAIRAAFFGVLADFVGSLRVDSRHALEGGEPGGEAIASSWISRLLPGTVRYRGRVHEQPQHALPVRRLPVTIGHSGYLPEALARKADRNARLLQREIADRPDDAYLWYQLGKDHDVHGRAAAALDCFARAETLRPCGPEAPGWTHDLSVRRLHALKCAGRHAEGIELASAQMALWSDSPDFFFALGDLMLDWAAREPRRAGELLPMIEGAWTRCLEIGERPELDGAVHGRGGELARHNLALLHGAQALGSHARLLLKLLCLRGGGLLDGLLLPRRVGVDGIRTGHLSYEAHQSTSNMNWPPSRV